MDTITLERVGPHRDMARDNAPFLDQLRTIIGPSIKHSVHSIREPPACNIHDHFPRKGAALGSALLSHAAKGPVQRAGASPMPNSGGAIFELWRQLPIGKDRSNLQPLSIGVRQRRLIGWVGDWGMRRDPMRCARGRTA
jgi:hypothetical protein